MKFIIPTPNLKEHVIAACFMTAILVSLVVLKNTLWDTEVKAVVIVVLLLVTGGISFFIANYQFKKNTTI